jgi:hypothetical protein
MGSMILTIFIVCLIEKGLKPRLDITKERELLLWYNDGAGRSFLKIF